MFWITAALLLLKLALLRFWLYGGISAAGHLVADAASVLALLSLIGLAASSRWRNAAYGTANAVLSVVLFAVTVYFAYYGSVPTYTALKAIDQVGQVRESVDALIRPVYYSYFADIVLILIGCLVFIVVQKVRKRRAGGRTLSPVTGHGGNGGNVRTDIESKTPVVISAAGQGDVRSTRERTGVRTVRRRAAARLWLLLGVAAGVTVSVLYVYDNRHVTNELVQSERLGLLSYEVAAAISQSREAIALKGASLEETKAEIEALQQSYPYVDGEPGATGQEGKGESFGAAKGMNVIVVQLEAFQAFPIGLLVQGQEVTPVLNSLTKESYYFPHVYQQIGQGNTSDAEFMSGTSIYPTGEAAMSTGYGDRELPSLQRLLAARGYTSATFHVNDVTFWDRNMLYPALGFDKYYDKPYYTNDHFNDFGASDEELYRFGTEELKKLSDEGKPFYAQFVTASSHYPFQVPDDRKRLKLPEGLDGTFPGDYLQAASYADYALGTLIDRLKAEGMWEHTMLVVYGDHFGVQPEKASDEFIRTQLGIAYDSRISRFNIPLLFHVPGTAGRTVETTGGQLDIMPTAAGLLGIPLADEGFTAFGRNLLAVDRNVIGMRYYLPTGSFFNDDVVFIPGSSFADGTAISLDTLQPVGDFGAYRADYDYVMKLMELSDRYVRLLPKR